MGRRAMMLSQAGGKELLLVLDGLQLEVLAGLQDVGLRLGEEDLADVLGAGGGWVRCAASRSPTPQPSSSTR